jgi:hypothetical protein
MAIIRLCTLYKAQVYVCMFASRARYNRFELYSLLFSQNCKIYKTVVFVVQNEDKSMHAVSTFNIDSVVVCRSLNFGIWSHLRTVSLSLCFAAVSCFCMLERRFYVLMVIILACILFFSSSSNLLLRSRKVNLYMYTCAVYNVQKPDDGHM